MFSDKDIKKLTAIFPTKRDLRLLCKRFGGVAEAMQEAEIKLDCLAEKLEKLHAHQSKYRTSFE